MALAFLGAIFLFGGAVITFVVRQSDTELRWYGKFLIVAGLLFVILPLTWGCASSTTGKALNVAVIGSGVADLASTRYAIDRGAVEKNPLMGQSAVQQAVVKGLGIGALFALTRSLERDRPIAAHLLRVFTIVVWSGLAIHNVGVGR